MRKQHGPMKEQHGPGSGALYIKRIGNYDLIKRIDVGGMGEVYLARQRSAFDREVALKIIRSDLCYDATARERFRREAHVTAHIRYEHVLSMIEFGTDPDGRLFYVTPYITGGTLAARLQKGPLSLDEVHELFTALVQAVAYIHSRGVIHRDLKPSNILLDDGVTPGQVYVRLIDFGIATMLGMAASPPLTVAGNEMGTLVYMAPERLSGVSAPSNDIYSLGIILYQMLTGQLPSTEVRIPLPQEMVYVIHRCITPQPEERFATANDLLDAFEDTYQYLNTPPQEAVAATPQPGTDGVPTPARSNSTRPHANPEQEVKTLSRSEDIPSLRPPLTNGFAPEDYDAPTTAIDHPGTSIAVEPIEGTPTMAPLPRRRSKRGKSLFALVLLSIVLVLLISAAVFFRGLQTATFATISFSVQAHSIGQVYQVTARPLQPNINVGAQSIPAKVLTSSKRDSQQGPTTGQVNCGFLGFGCQQAVAPADVQSLDLQLKQTLEPQITQDLQMQAQAIAGSNQVGHVFFRTLNETVDPSVGTVSKTVTVALTEEGSIEYFTTDDAQNLARQLLAKQAQQLGPNFVLLNPTVLLGQPSILSVDSNGVVAIAIAAAGVAQYQVPASQMTDMQNQLKGLKKNEASAFLKQQPGVDAATVTISVSIGDTLPTDGTHIKLVAVSPAILPPVQLPAVPTPSSSVSPTGTPST